MMCSHESDEYFFTSGSGTSSCVSGVHFNRHEYGLVVTYSITAIGFGSVHVCSHALADINQMQQHGAVDH